MDAPESERRTPAPFGRRVCIVRESRGVGAYRLLTVADPEGPARPRAGQFYMLAPRASGGDEETGRPFVPRAFSFLRVAEGELSFLLEEIGPGTRRLGALEPGEELWVAGPFGLGFVAPPSGRRALLVGGGIGIVPLTAWQGEMADREPGSSPPALLGFRDSPHAEAATLMRSVELCTDDGSRGRRALVTELLRTELAREEATVVYACGPPPMLEAVRAMCAERDVPAQLALEAGMACGYGACFGCAVPTRDGFLRLCLDGPVLEASQLETALIPGTGH